MDKNMLARATVDWLSTADPSSDASVPDFRRFAMARIAESDSGAQALAVFNRRGADEVGRAMLVAVVHHLLDEDDDLARELARALPDHAPGVGAAERAATPASVGVGRDMTMLRSTFAMGSVDKSRRTRIGLGLGGLAVAALIGGGTAYQVTRPGPAPAVNSAIDIPAVLDAGGLPCLNPEDDTGNDNFPPNARSAARCDITDPTCTNRSLDIITTASEIQTQASLDSVDPAYIKIKGKTWAIWIYETSDAGQDHWALDADYAVRVAKILHGEVTSFGVTRPHG